MIGDQERTAPGDNGRARFRYSYKVPPPEGSVGEALRRDREAKGWTQAEVVANFDYHQTKLSQYERGEIKQPPGDRLIALARLYGRPDSYYLDLAGYPGTARLADWRKRISGAVVVEQPRPGLQQIIDDLCVLQDPIFQRVAQIARQTAIWQEERDSDPHTMPAAIRDTA
ncbi:MAG: helix-turn-helix domain-containing protein [Dehalococcoidia bacterium]